MSLINDALKKAQKQRTGEAPSLASMPSIGGERATSIARGGKPANRNMLFLGLGAAGLVILVIGGYFALRSAPVGKTAQVATPAPANTSVATTAAAPGSTSAAFSLPIALPAEPKVSAGQTPGSQSGTTVQPSSVPPAPATASEPKTVVTTVAPAAAPVPVPAKPVGPAPTIKTSAAAAFFLSPERNCSFTRFARWPRISIGPARDRKP